MARHMAKSGRRRPIASAVLNLFFTLFGWTCAALAIVGGGYCAYAALAVRRFFADACDTAAEAASPLPPISILKPLRGGGVDLTDALETFCVQANAPALQLVFGWQDEHDSAAAAVAALRLRRPDMDIACVVDPRVDGENRKISNVVNICAEAKYDTLVLSDADIAVGPDYLRRVVEPLNRPGVGGVTCLYVGRAIAGGWSQLAAMAINYQFMTNVVVGLSLGLATPCFGSTIALSRATLSKIGGFAPFKNRLADDYEIGRAIRSLGLRIAVPPMTVVHTCAESSLAALIDHEIRWARTVRVLDPAGHAGSVVTHSLPLALIAGALLGLSPIGVTLIFAVLGVRIAAKFAIDRATGARAGPWWLLPLRDVLSFGVFVASFLGSTVDWQGRRFRVSRDGVLTPL